MLRALALRESMKYLIILILLPLAVMANESTCYGTTSNGSLKDGVKLPSSGSNFEGYSSIASIAGRTYVHSTVRDIIVTSYKSLELEHPEKVFKYAETGFKEGGQFKPHKTHRNGLSVDFMVPVVNENGESVHLPTSPLNKFGYNIEFDQNAKYEQYQIDFEAMAAHIVSLHKETKRRGYDLWRVIFDPELRPYLFKTKYAEYLLKNIQFSKKRSWVRHDEHYHIDFEIPCKS
jgi:penicillin-insensitive murein endopeptidase